MSDPTPTQFRVVTVSARRTTKLKLIVPKGIDDDAIRNAITANWNGDKLFYNRRYKLMLQSGCVIEKSESIDNDALIEDWAQEPDIDVGADSARSVLNVWMELVAFQENVDDLAAKLNEQIETTFAGKDPAQMSNIELTSAVKWMYPGNDPASIARMSRQKKLAAYREYFARLERERAEVNAHLHCNERTMVRHHVARSTTSKTHHRVQV